MSRSSADVYPLHHDHSLPDCSSVTTRSARSSSRYSSSTRRRRLVYRRPYTAAAARSAALRGLYVPPGEPAPARRAALAPLTPRPDRVKMPSILSDEDKQTVKRTVPKQNNKIFAVAVAKLYVAHPHKHTWTYTGLQGAAVLANDLVGNTLWIKLVDISVRASRPLPAGDADVK
jgi:hypothetical protein